MLRLRILGSIAKQSFCVLQSMVLRQLCSLKGNTLRRYVYLGALVNQRTLEGRLERSAGRLVQHSISDFVFPGSGLSRLPCIVAPSQQASNCQHGWPLPGFLASAVVVALLTAMPVVSHAAEGFAGSAFGQTLTSSIHNQGRLIFKEGLDNIATWKTWNVAFSCSGIFR